MTSSDLFENDRPLWSYLSFGYLPAVDPEKPFKILQNSDTGIPERRPVEDHDGVISEAADRLGGLGGQVVAQHPNKQHVVLLSGGYDSRAILGSLLTLVDRKAIIACTYGYAGNEETEFALRIAKSAGIEHEFIRVEQTQWSTDELLESGRQRTYPPSFLIGQRFQNYRIYRQLGRECIFWDGLLGGSVTGAVLKGASPPSDWRTALDAFGKMNLIRRPKLAPPHFDPLTVLPQTPICSERTVEFEDQLNLCVRQTCYIRNRAPDGFITATPFAEEQSWRFWLGLPREFRFEQSLYRAALLRAFPDLYRIPVAGGRGRVGASPWQETLDSWRRRGSARLRRAMGKLPRHSVQRDLIGQQMRENPSLRDVMGENIADLSRRRLLTWLDLPKMWSDHLSGTAGYTQALRILVTLELALKLAESETSLAAVTAAEFAKTNR